MEIGTIWTIDKPESNWLWYHLFASDPVPNDIVVVLNVEPTFVSPDDSIVWYISLVTGTKDFMREEDFLKTFITLKEVNEQNK